MAERWQQGAPVDQSPTPQRGGGWITDPYKVNAEARADRSADRQDAAALRAADAAARSASSAEASAAKTQQEIGDRDYSRGDKLRADFDKRQQVQDYRTAAPLLISALKTKRDPQGDNALIYAYAKIMDPNSVVRESEAETAANTAGYLDAQAERIKRNLGFEDAVGLPRGASANLLREMNTKVAQFAKAYGAVRRDFQDLAQRQGVNAEDVVGRSPAEPFLEQYQRLSKEQGWTDTPAAIPTTQAREIDPTGANSRLSPQDRDFISSNARYMTPAGMKQWYADKGLNISDQEASDAFSYYQQGGQQDAAVNVPQGQESTWGSFAASPAGALGTGYLNGVMLGGLDEVGGGINAIASGQEFGRSIAEADQRKQASASAHPVMYNIGQIAGGLTGAGVSGGLGVGARAPLLTDIGLGGVSGALESNDNRLVGAGIGGTVGGGLGMAFRGLSRVPQRPANGDATLSQAIERAGIDRVRGSLTEARNLDIPMTLADTDPALSAIAGSAVRFSPEAERLASNTLLPRSRGQIDRFGSAVERDLGPLADPAQQSEALLQQARTAAAPLYEEAYRAPVIGTPTLDSLIQTPFGRQAVNKARTIAANERRDPEAMGFRLDADGNAVLNPIPHDQLGRLGQAETSAFEAGEALKRAQQRQLTGGGGQSVADAQAAYDAAQDVLGQARHALAARPTVSTAATSPGYTTQTLDYAKRGMDDVLEQYRNPVTGKLDLTTAGRAENNVRSSFLNELDALNPAYGKARAAYQGPMELRDALAAGRDAVRQSPREVQTIAGRSGPAQMEQMRLGYRTGLDDRANDMRFSANPFESVLGTPAAEQRLSAVYGADSPGVGRLLRQRDIERDLSRSTNNILGNSMTQQRKIADEAFSNSLPVDLLDSVADVASGKVPVRTAIGMFGRAALKDRARLGTIRNAEKRADELAPSLFDTDTTNTLDFVDSLLSRTADYRNRQRLVEPIVGQVGGAVGGMVPGWLLGN